MRFDESPAERLLDRFELRFGEHMLVIAARADERISGFFNREFQPFTTLASEFDDGAQGGLHAASV